MNPAWKTYLKAALNLFTVLVAAFLCIFLLPRCIWFFMPFIMGWIISLIASPVVRFFEEKLKVKRKAMSAVVIVAVLAVVVLFVYLLLAKLVREGVNFFHELPNIWNTILAELNKVGANLQVVYDRMPANVQETIDQIGQDMGDYVSGILGNIELPSFEAVGNVAKQIPDIFLGVVMCLLSAYFFVADKGYLAAAAEKYIPTSVRYHLNLIRRSFRNAVGGYFRAQLKIECWIYILLVIGLMILDVDYAFLVAFGIAILDFLPVFGTGTVMLPWAVIELLSENYKMMFGLIAIWLIGQLVRQVIQPKIVGDSIGMDAIPTLFLLYIGYKAAGVIGMIFAVPIGIILVNLYEEGAFDTTAKSLRILTAGFNRFRRIRPEDMAAAEAYERETKAVYRQNAEQDKAEKEQLHEASQIKLEEPQMLKKIKDKKKTKS
ncbi:MAG: sporulation integral membrane protein YtvI [Bacteroidales bacterium]|nr:sporulation integral membrane protein YtvI [Bacteroidales bacterium]MCM1415648.1 sporulation integral membrane protein YtvI [bacterium]MCM1422968.1 sporulation integral membrane protein YtvI [bacterium]